jgi:hypothetical protein
MKRFKLHLLAAAFCVGAAPAVSADFDGSKALICSSIEAHDCELGVTCLRKVAEDLNVPQFIRLDFAKKTLSARGRTSQMQNYQRSGGMLILQGVENDRAFSVTINEQSGKLVGAIAADEEGYMIFGACTPL